MTTNKPSAGAVRAAQRLTAIYDDLNNHTDVAHIIDAETGTIESDTLIEELGAALTVSLPRMAHRPTCWKRVDKIVPEKSKRHRNRECLCEISKVNAALAAYREWKESHDQT